MKRDDAVIDGDVVARVQRIAAAALARDLDAQGWSVQRDLLTPAECDDITGLYDQDAGFRSRVVMARHGFGRGEYRYFSYPLPTLVQRLRTALYPRLAPIANQWHERMGLATRFPAAHDAFIAQCAAAGQSRPTPLQVAVLLSAPGADFSGGEFVLTEQRPRMQTRASVVPLTKGDAVVFAVNSRPVRGTRGDYRVKLRHGVSQVIAGHRHTLGIIFHDAS